MPTTGGRGGIGVGVWLTVHRHSWWLWFPLLRRATVEVAIDVGASTSLWNIKILSGPLGVHLLRHV